MVRISLSEPFMGTLNVKVVGETSISAGGKTLTASHASSTAWTSAELAPNKSVAASIAPTFAA